MLDLFRDRAGPVSIAVRLDNGDHTGAGRQIPVHALHVVRDRGEIDLRTDSFIAHSLLPCS